MTTLADRIKEYIENAEMASCGINSNLELLHLGMYVHENAPAILTALAASERLAKENAELRAALDESRKAAAWLRDRSADDPGLHEALSNLTTNITAALSPQEPTP